MPPLPLVSVVIPAYNSAAFLGDALLSVRSQGYAPLEVIVVDDGSTDATPEVVSRLGADLVYVRQPRRGAAAARNRGLAEAHGKVVAFLDADDVWPCGALARQVTRLEAPAADVVLGRSAFLRVGDEAVSADDGEGSWFVPLLGSAVFRRAVFDRVGAFDESLQCSEDHDWFLRARELGVGIATTEAVTLLYRVRAGSLTRSPERPYGYQLAHVLKRSLDRRRRLHIGALPPFPGQTAFAAKEGT
jgi:glycosyltransferase involved in cell wall biosynthesis